MLVTEQKEQSNGQPLLVWTGMLLSLRIPFLVDFSRERSGNGI
jgi:hypothetical protein